MKKPFKISFAITALGVAVWMLYGAAAAQIVGGGTPVGYGELPVISPLDCGETKKLVGNQRTQPKTYYVEVADCCDGVDSVLYLNSIQNPIYFVPDGGSLCASVTLQQGDSLYLDCNGGSDGDCTVNFKTSCNTCP